MSPKPAYNLQDPALATYISSVLKLFCLQHDFTLPKMGLIAGGFISNTIYNYFHKTPLVLNDVDVFYLDGRSLTAGKDNRPEPYPGIGSYQILHNIKSCKDRLNLISVKPPGGHVNISSVIQEVRLQYLDAAKTMIESFDLNCCQAGYDLNSGTVLVSDRFKDFINRREIEITSMSSAASTFFRSLTKQKDLQGSTFDIPLAASLCSQPFLQHKSADPETAKAFTETGVTYDPTVLPPAQKRYLEEHNSVFANVSYGLQGQLLKRLAPQLPEVLKHFDLLPVRTASCDYFLRPKAKVLHHNIPVSKSTTDGKVFIRGITRWSDFLDAAYASKAMSGSTEDFI